MKLYMVRHGQSETNLTQCFTGWAQVSLTEKGFADARKAGEYLRGRTFDRVYSSDLLRAVQTAQTALPGCEPIQLPLLREIGLGTLERRSIDLCEQELGPEFHANRIACNFLPYGGENNEMLCQRVRDFFALLEQDPCDQVIAFSHMGVLTRAIELVLGVPLDRSRVRCGNGSVAVFSYERGRWILETWGAALA